MFIARIILFFNTPPKQKNVPKKTENVDPLYFSKDLRFFSNRKSPKFLCLKHIRDFPINIEIPPHNFRGEQLLLTGNVFSFPP
jgi:hypothetical protein